MDPRKRRTKPERWLPVVGYEGKYEVSDSGRVKSLTYRGHPRTPPRLLKGEIDRCGYVRICLTRNGEERKKFLHLLVMEAFVGPCPTGLETCHEDGNSLNCMRSNLVYGTHSRNMLDKARHGTSSRGEANIRAKLTSVQVAEIRSRFRQGEPAKAVQAAYPIALSGLYKIKYRETWRHVP